MHHFWKSHLGQERRGHPRRQSATLDPAGKQAGSENSQRPGRHWQGPGQDRHLQRPG